MICAGTDLQWFFAICTDEMTRRCSGGVMSFNHLSSCVWLVARWWSSSCGPVLPPKYFLPVNTWDNCFALTKNRSHTSFAVPSLKYLRDNLSHTAAVKILVGPLRGSCFRQVALGMGSTVFFTFSFFSSSDVRAFLSSRGI